MPTAILCQVSPCKYKTNPLNVSYSITCPLYKEFPGFCFQFCPLKWTTVVGRRHPGITRPWSTACLLPHWPCPSCLFSSTSNNHLIHFLLWHHSHTSWTTAGNEHCLQSRRGKCVQTRAHLCPSTQQPVFPPLPPNPPFCHVVKVGRRQTAKKFFFLIFTSCVLTMCQTFSLTQFLVHLNSRALPLIASVALFLLTNDWYSNSRC